MQRQAMWARTERMAFAVWLLASAGACTSWQTQEVSPQELIAQKHPDEIRVTLPDSSQVEISLPSLAGDTVLGTAKSGRGGPRVNGNAVAFGQGTASSAEPGSQVRIPASDVVRIQTSHADGGETALLVVGTLAVVGGALLIAASQSAKGISVPIGCGFFCGGWGSARAPH